MMEEEKRKRAQAGIEPDAPTQPVSDPPPEPTPVPVPDPEPTSRRSTPRRRSMPLPAPVTGAVLSSTGQESRSGRKRRKRECACT